MSIVKNIKKFILNYRYKRRFSKVKRKKRLPHKKDIQTAGLLFFLNTPEAYAEAIEIINGMQDDITVIQALGFYNRKNLPSFFHQSVFFDIFTKKDINWTGKPIGSAIRNFTNKDFDLLIDLTPVDLFVTKYISGISIAKCKLGRYHKSNEAFFDFMLEIPDNTKQQYFIEQSLYYLDKINQPNDY